MQMMVHSLQLVGILCMILGALLFIAPLFLEQLPSLSNLPWILLYIYRRDGFVFVTSPLLLILSVMSLLWWLLTRTSTS
jgi:hypothetical protein